MSHDDHEVEPIPGLPELPPEGESILWQGSPDWWSVSRRVMHVDIVVAYVVLMLAWRAATSVGAGRPVGEQLLGFLPLVGLSLLGIAILVLIARGIARTTIYTITNRRVVLRYGIALPVTLNLPFRHIASADLRTLDRGRGDIALRLSGDQRLAYLVLWPHVRPWRLRSPEPMLRGLSDANGVAAILGDALAADMARRPAPPRVARPDAASDAGNVARPALVAAE